MSYKLCGLYFLTTNSFFKQNKKTMATKEKSTDKKKSLDSQFYDLFIHELKDIYWAEKHLAEELPKMGKEATSDKLIKAIEKHGKETDNQVNRLEQVFEHLGVKASGEKCEAMAGLLKEAKEILKENKDNTMVKDAGIIIACQKVEHYEIATYGSLVSLSKKMGADECTKLLEETLEEEKKTDASLTKLAESEINEKAMKE